MTVFFADGHRDRVIPDDELQHSLQSVLQTLGPRQRVMAIPPDQTRANSRAGLLTQAAYEFFGDRLVDILPALGTHKAMGSKALGQMFPGIPESLFRVHEWEVDAVTVGTVSADFVAAATEGVYRKPWPAQLNRRLVEGQHDLILSIGQVVPHEVIGMANYNKNIFVGTGGVLGINESHFIGAVYGMERIMGRWDTPLRRILNHAEDLFCRDLPLIYVLTVVGTDADGQLVTRGLFVGDDPECFRLASELSLQVNFEMLDHPPRRIVAYLDPEEFQSTWLGNKAIYRTRMAIADAGELLVLAPGVGEFGEKPAIDRLIYKYGYRATPDILNFVDTQADLRANLSAAAHLIHGSSEGRFQITYCPGHLDKVAIEAVGYRYGDLATMLEHYPPGRPNGWYTDDDGPYYYIDNPALGLWATQDRFHDRANTQPLA